MSPSPSPSRARTSASSPTGRTVGILSTFPPTACGIATFSASLATGIIARGDTAHIVRTEPGPEIEDPMVRGGLGRGARGWSTTADGDQATAALNRTDVVIVQHEYGLYDGRDGADVLDVVDRIDVPVIVIAHTVLAAPTDNQRRVLAGLCTRADAVVAMTASGRNRLAADYGVPAAKLHLIPHGAAITPLAERTPRRPGPIRLLTWGLLGPGKGIEWAIDALAGLDDLTGLDGLDVDPVYVVAGATHPKVRAHAGEAYRQMLMDRVAARGVHHRVAFDDTYRGLQALTDLVTDADLVVLPYDSVDQVTSGVLVDAVGAGRPVVSTAFPHAVELLASGAGMVVPQADPLALRAAIHRALTEPGRLGAMTAEARRLAPDLSWRAIAGRYAEVADTLLGDTLDIDLTTPVHA